MSSWPSQKTAFLRTSFHASAAVEADHKAAGRCRGSLAPTHRGRRAVHTGSAFTGCAGHSARAAGSAGRSPSRQHTVHDRWICTLAVHPAREQAAGLGPDPEDGWHAPREGTGKIGAMGEHGEGREGAGGGWGVSALSQQEPAARLPSPLKSTVGPLGWLGVLKLATDALAAAAAVGLPVGEALAQPRCFLHPAPVTTNTTVATPTDRDSERDRGGV
jgi:hypothetical protein